MGLEILANIRDAVGSLERFLDQGRGISTVRSVDWDRRYLWLAEFDKDTLLPPAPFKEWFPANSVSINDTSQSKEEFKFGQQHLSIPTSQSGASTLSITFYDDINRTLQKWFTDWIRLDIQNNGQYISGLDDDHDAEAADSFGTQRRVWPVRTINIIYLNLDRSNYITKRYSIVPDGDFSKELSQASEAVEYTLTFSIVGEGVGASGSTDNFLNNLISDTLGRVI